MALYSSTGRSWTMYICMFGVFPSILASNLVNAQKRDQQCGFLNGYPNAQAPSCTGIASICTFSAGRQGCCDNSNHCTFYTSCNGGLVAAPCTAVACLQCPSATPYCARYSLGPFEGYACGVVDVGNSIIYGVVSTVSATVTSTSSPVFTLTTSSRPQTPFMTSISSSLHSSVQVMSNTSRSAITSSMASSANISSSSLVMSISATNTSSSLAASSGTKTSSAASYTGTSSANLQANKAAGLGAGAIAGIVVAIVLFAVMAVLAVWCLCRRRGRPGNQFGKRAQLQQGHMRPTSTYSD